MGGWNQGAWWVMGFARVSRRGEWATESVLNQDGIVSIGRDEMYWYDWYECYLPDGLAQCVYRA